MLARAFSNVNKYNQIIANFLTNDKHYSICNILKGTVHPKIMIIVSLQTYDYCDIAKMFCKRKSYSHDSVFIREDCPFKKMT